MIECGFAGRRYIVGQITVNAGFELVICRIDSIRGFQFGQSSIAVPLIWSLPVVRHAP